MNAEQKRKKRAEPGEVFAVLSRILAENGREYLWHYALAILCLVAMAGATAFTAWIMRDVINELFYRGRRDLIVLVAGSVAAAFLLRGLANYGQSVVLSKVGNNLVARYQRRLFDHLMRLSFDFFTDTRSGQLAARINENVNGIRDLLGMTLKSVAGDAVSLVALLAVMIIQEPLLSAIALLIGPPLVYTVNRLMRRLRRISRESVQINSRLTGAMQEATQGIAIVKAFTMEDQLAQRIGLLIAAAEARANKIARVSERVTPVSETLAGLAIAAVIAYASYRATAGIEPPGSVFSFTTALLLAYDPARRLARVQVNLERSLVNARMIYEILDLKPRQGDVPGAKALVVHAGDVRFDHVSFGYVAGLPVLHDVSFQAAPGKTTAIVGGSGAGKSTLTALLERFYDVDQGTITIDGQDISQVTKHSLRQATVILPPSTS